MPHCLIEHSAQLDGQQLMYVVHKGVLASGLFEPNGADIKVRAQSFTNGLVGGRPADFIHVTLRILAGRSSAQKAALASNVLQTLHASGALDCAMSVEIVDIDSDSYRKSPHLTKE